MRKIGLMIVIIILGIFSVFLVSSQDNDSNIPALCPDFNEDGILNQTDFELFSENYAVREVDSTNAEYDLNEDGTINFADFILFGQNYKVGKMCPVEDFDDGADSDCIGMGGGVQTGNCSAEGKYCYSGSCCGDDSNEYFVYQKAGTSPYIENKPSEGRCYIQETVPAFCLFSDDGKQPGSYVGSVDNTQYKYSDGAIAGSLVGNIWRGAICNAGLWDELCDVNQNACNAGCGVQWQTESIWMSSEGFCCGDDGFEFYTQGTDETSACCAGADYFVEDGICREKVHDVAVEVVAPTNANAGEDVEVKAKVSNKGDFNENVSVIFSVEDGEGNITYEDNKNIIDLKKNNTEEVSFIWSAVKGVYNLVLEVFADDDSDESNNEATGVINISAPVQEPEPPECSIGEIKCEGTNYFTCVVDEWFGKGEVPGKCGVEIPTSCEDTDGGLDYFTAGNAKLKLDGKYKGRKDVCKRKSTTNLGDFLNNVGVGGGHVVYNEYTNYLYEAYCKNGIPSTKIKECDCYNGACI
ncbi:MAG: hypothetical protein KJ905_00650 [Nanoarchaeota archaeon]|nr:hypothetical protein [Nanoarchaeota archaeon]